MRDTDGNKVGALSVEEATNHAREIIAESGVCLFLVDGVNFSKRPSEERARLYDQLFKFCQRANELFADVMPVNDLALSGRFERGFQSGLGDARWAGIDDAAVVKKLVTLKEDEFPGLPLYYGVAKDGWDDGMVLVK